MKAAGRTVACDGAGLVLRQLNKKQRKKKAEGEAKKHGEQLFCPAEHEVKPRVGMLCLPSSRHSSSSRHSLPSVPTAGHSPDQRQSPWHAPGHAHQTLAPALSFHPAPGGESSSGGSLMAWLTVHVGSSVLGAVPGTVGMDAEVAELCPPAPGAVRLPPPL